MPSCPLTARRSYSRLSGDGPSQVPTLSQPVPSRLAKQVADISSIQTYAAIILLATSFCMEPGYYGPSHLQGQGRDQVRRVDASHSSPLPQTQWTDVPLPYRPREWSPRDSGSAPPPPFSWRLRSPPSQPSVDVPSRTRSAAASKRRPQRLRSHISDLGATVQEQRPSDVSLLYPQLSPYDTQLSSQSAPPELEFPRSVSQPTTPSWLARQYEPGEVHSLQIPRSPTFPPMGRRRRAHTAGEGEEAFDDEAEFRLFVEATSGLSPEQAYRHSSSSGSSRRQARSNQDDSDYDEEQPEEHIVSPLEETPTTLAALRHLAHFPQGAVNASLLPSHSQRHRLETSASGLDLWLNPQSRSVRQQREIVDVSPIEEELPDYASSQAQAQAQSRAAAARRADELQIRWRQTGAQQGHW